MPPMAYVKKYCKMIDKWLEPEEDMEELLNKIYVEGIMWGLHETERNGCRRETQQLQRKQLDI